MALIAGKPPGVANFALDIGKLSEKTASALKC